MKNDSHFSLGIGHRNSGQRLVINVQDHFAFGLWKLFILICKAEEVPTHLGLIEGAILNFLFMPMEKKCPCDNCVNEYLPTFHLRMKGD
jgi:hypothetical protein